jgi:hypothetical protein
MTMTILALAFCIGQAPGATVRGRVVDSVSGGSLQRVLVAVEETGLSTHTDADGGSHFSFRRGLD